MVLGGLTLVAGSQGQLQNGFKQTSPWFPASDPGAS